MMQFSPASVRSIKSISQHALTLYWNRLLGVALFPQSRSSLPDQDYTTQSNW
jgi:hypothetical protein